MIELTKPADLLNRADCHARYREVLADSLDAFRLRPAASLRATLRALSWLPDNAHAEPLLRAHAFARLHACLILLDRMEPEVLHRWPAA